MLGANQRHRLPARLQAAPVALERGPDADVAHAVPFPQQIDGVRQTVREPFGVHVKPDQCFGLAVGARPAVIDHDPGHGDALGMELLHLLHDGGLADVTAERVPRTPAEPGQGFRQRPSVNRGDAVATRAGRDTDADDGVRIGAGQGSGDGMRLRDISSFLIAPLVVSGRLTGFLEVENPTRSRVEEARTALAAISKFIAATIERFHLLNTLEHHSRHDPLTGLGNRRALDQAIQRDRQASALAVLMVDVDNFKLYNDTLGHLAGDVALQTVARMVKQNCARASDKTFRYGGEEFVGLLIATGREGAMSVAESLRDSVEKLHIPHPGLETGVLTISVGVASREQGETTHVEELLAHADIALYAAKNSGRNRVCLYAKEQPPVEAHPA